MSVKPAILEHRLPEVLLRIAYHAEANRSDPFASPRAAAHFRSGVAGLDDFTYSSEREKRWELVHDTKPEVYREVTVHINQKRP